MATDTTTVKIDGDASGLKGAAKQGQDALKGLGKTTQAQGDKLGLYGEKLGKAFGPGEGLHGKLENLESPIRDSEGAFARASQAVITFGNDGASATDKISAGFLLAGDSIASFMSGGAIGLAVAAAVAGIALLVDTMGDESEASLKAAEAAKEHSDALNALAKAAVAANITVGLQQAKEREKEVRERTRFVEAERLAIGERYNALIDRRDKFDADFVKASTVAAQKAAKAGQALTKQLLEEEGKKFKLLDAEHQKAIARISDANEKVQEETAKSQENTITKLIAFLDKSAEATTKTVEKEAKKRVRSVETFSQLMDRAAKSDKERTESQRALGLEDEAFDKRLEERKEERAKAARARLLEGSQEFHDANVELFKARAAEEERLANVQKRIETDLQSVRQGAINSFTDGLFQMAHAGEVNFAKLADSVLASTGKQLVSRGTLHLFEGLAASFGGNPAGAAQAAVGGKMIVAGLAMGAVGGAIGRAGAPPEEKKTPTDTRSSAAASSSSGSSGGGTTVINFNGPAYDKRSVSNVITSGQRMAKHRRVQGA